MHKDTEPKHVRVYRDQNDATRVIKVFGQKPSEQVKTNIREGLSKEQGKFLAIDQLRSRQKQQQRSRGR